MPADTRNRRPSPAAPLEVRFAPVQVTCYAGYRADETPRSLRRPGRPCLAIDRILQRWIEPRHRFFKVVTADGRTRLLRQDVETLGWEMRAD